jgi:hypothetical protein
MAVEISPDEELPSVLRLKDFSATVSATIAEGEEGGEESATIVSVTAQLVGSSDPGIVITPGSTSVTISGKHITGFQDILTYVDKGQSDKTQAPKSVSGIENMPAGQNLFDLNQDKKQSLDRQFLITVTLDDDSAQSFTLKQTVINDLESMRSFMGSYFK